MPCSFSPAFPRLFTLPLAEAFLHSCRLTTNCHQQIPIFHVRIEISCNRFVALGNSSAVLRATHALRDSAQNRGCYRDAQSEGKEK
ncbi:hypothetical protein M011DRAFT_48454 [Sporormia fimetaria CBS 119925]|uniref:Uncharacterized protein n=1 Tax=Sporormia fimetaria CBS 119925 TaxID=1340428 RepID=A0A6A6VAF8_9PLEO|nr:hypothetical protein M011DRAFT_48454 [Sporormia fimetaria CBS 119925]